MADSLVWKDKKISFLLSFVADEPLACVTELRASARDPLAQDDISRLYFFHFVFVTIGDVKSSVRISFALSSIE